MGTNYYARINTCKCCGRAKEEIHIGKSSSGWKFAIEIHEEYYNSIWGFEEFIKKKNVLIYNEYGDKITAEDLIDIINSKSKDKSHFDTYPEDKFADCEEADLSKRGFS